jgi:ribosomal protein L29
MKSNDIKALATKTIDELETQLTTLQEELAQSRLKKSVGKQKNTHLSLLSDDIARIKTSITLKKKSETKKK